MTPDVGVLTTLLQSFEQAFRGGYVNIQGHALSLMAVLVALELTFLGLFAAMGGGEIATPMIKKLLTIGFFSWVVLEFSFLTEQLLLGFSSAGSIAAGSAPASAITDPSLVVEQGFQVATPLFEYAKKTNDESWVGVVFDGIIACASAIVVIVSYYLIALQIFITRLEFSLLVSISIILVPFGVLQRTAFLAEKTFGAIISFGIKLMLLTFLVAIAMPLLTQYSVPPDPTWDEMLNMVFVSLTFAYLSWHVPSVTAGMLTGGPSLSGLGVLSPAISGGMSALGAAAGGALGAGAAALGAAGKAAAGGGLSLVKSAAGAMGGGGGGSSSSSSFKGAGQTSSSSSGGGVGTTNSGVSKSSGGNMGQPKEGGKSELRGAREVSGQGGNNKAGKGSEERQAATKEATGKESGAKASGPSSQGAAEKKGGGGLQKSEEKDGEESNFGQKGANSKGGVKAAAKAGLVNGARFGSREGRAATPPAPNPIAGLSVPLADKE